MPFSQNTNHDVLNQWCCISDWSFTINDLYIGLSETTPTTTGTNVTEPSGGAYARVQIEAADWDTPASSSIATDVLQEWTQATADWVSGADLTYMVFYNDPTATASANFKGFQALGTAKPVLDGDTASIAVGDLTVSLNEA